MRRTGRAPQFHSKNHYILSIGLGIIFLLSKDFSKIVLHRLLYNCVSISHDHTTASIGSSSSISFIVSFLGLRTISDSA